MLHCVLTRLLLSNSLIEAKSGHCDDGVVRSLAFARDWLWGWPGRGSISASAGSRRGGVRRHGRQGSWSRFIHFQPRCSGHRPRQHARSQGGSQPSVSSKCWTHTRVAQITRHIAASGRNRRLSITPSVGIKKCSFTNNNDFVEFINLSTRSQCIVLWLAIFVWFCLFRILYYSFGNPKIMHFSSRKIQK